MNKVDYYEFLQISPKAEDETIHRVYRFLAARYHPDNPESGNSEKFSTLAAAYEVLSNPKTRSEYDSGREQGRIEAVPLSTTIDFLDRMEGENNRRVALLAVLYYKRRSSPFSPEVSLMEVETRLGFPRDYLDFTTWYLQKKGLITKADNSDFTLTAPGVDFVESQRVNLPVLNELLTAGAGIAANGSAAKGHTSSMMIEDLSHLVEGDISVLAPDVAIPEGTRTIERRLLLDRRSHSEDQRADMADNSVSSTERRMAIHDRRINQDDQHSNITNGFAAQANGHADPGTAPANDDRSRDIAAAMDRLIAMVDENMDAIYGNTGDFANGLKDQLAASVQE
jgi:hypothetical protein